MQIMRDWHGYERDRAIVMCPMRAGLLRSVRGLATVLCVPVRVLFGYGWHGPVHPMPRWKVRHHVGLERVPALPHGNVPGQPRADQLPRVSCGIIPGQHRADLMHRVQGRHRPVGSSGERVHTMFARTVPEPAWHPDLHPVLGRLLSAGLGHDPVPSLSRRQVPAGSRPDHVHAVPAGLVSAQRRPGGVPAVLVRTVPGLEPDHSVSAVSEWHGERIARGHASGPVCVLPKRDVRAQQGLERVHGVQSRLLLGLVRQGSMHGMLHWDVHGRSRGQRVHVLPDRDVWRDHCWPLPLGVPGLPWRLVRLHDGTQHVLELRAGDFRQRDGTLHMSCVRDRHRPGQRGVEFLHVLLARGVHAHPGQAHMPVVR